MQITLLLVAYTTLLSCVASGLYQCTDHICNEIPGFTRILIRTFSNEISAKENDVTKQQNVKQCINVSDGLGMMMLLTQNHSNGQNWAAENQKHIWLTGNCSGNISIILATNPILNCNFENLKMLTFQNTDTKVPTRINVMSFAECMAHLFLTVIANESMSSLNSTLNSCVNTHESMCSLHINDDDADVIRAVNATASIDITDTPSPVTGKANSNTTKPPLHKHHGHGTGNIPYLIITLVCTLCGGSCLTFLLCFNRTRHLICSCCGICRDVNRYSQFFNDD